MMLMSGGGGARTAGNACSTGRPDRRSAGVILGFVLGTAVEAPVRHVCRGRAPIFGFSYAALLDATQGLEDTVAHPKADWNHGGLSRCRAVG